MQKQEILKLLSDFISIQSVSTDSKRLSEILQAVEFLTKNLKSMGFEIKLLKKNTAPPLILATKSISKKGKTIGIYGHYDVQPEDPVDEWATPPFKLTVKNGKIFGRGVADNKGHVIQNIISIKHLIEINKLNNNIVLIFEGEEECGSSNFEKYVAKTKEILKKVDVFYLLDAGMYEKNMPQIFYGLRGLVYFELDVNIGSKDLHSGIYGNRVLNPAQVLADLFATMKESSTGKILIPGFYDKVKKISEKERQFLKQVARSGEGQKEEAGVYKVISQDARQPYISSKVYPSLDINGIISGYVGEGQKTIIPKSAKVKFSTRLVENQSPDETEKLVYRFIKNNITDGVKWNLSVLSKDAPFYTDFENEYVKKTANIFEDIFGNKTRFNRSGGSIPAAEILQRIYKKPIIVTGFTLPDDNIHSPNENFDEEMLFKGIQALEIIYSQ